MASLSLLSSQSPGCSESEGSLLAPANIDLGVPSVASPSAKLRLSVKSVLNLPVPLACCKRVDRTIIVRCKEIEPPREDKLPLPATFLFEGASMQDDGCAEFPSGEHRRFAEVTCEKARRLRFEVLNYRHAFIGFAEIDAVDLARKRLWRLLLSTIAGDAIYGGSGVRTPAFLEVVVRCSDAVDNTEFEHVPGFRSTGPRTSDRKRVMIMTRGTRGDVQPYVALARGLASPKFNCDVTIVTEIHWKQFITDNKNGLPPGSIHFRPCGGDTALQTSSDIAIHALKLGQYSDALQAIIMSKSEQNFFSSEGCFYFWAEEERPDFIVFGFTVSHIAMIISEALRIPIVGFVMQPARSIEQRPPAGTIRDEMIGPLRGIFNSTEFNAALMHIMQKIPDGTPTLNRLRRSRSLNPFPSGLTTEFLQYTELQKQGIPQIVPINPLALGEEQINDIQSAGMTLTDFIFLRVEGETLDSEIEGFIEQAKAAAVPLITIAFSSMPVGARKILEVAVQICDKCYPEVDPGHSQHKPALIVFIGGQDFDPVPPDSELAASVQRLSDNKRLLVRRKGAAFGLLFPQMDAVITQGGLGTTSEALVSGIPAIVSGILLMDQRYWAKRISELAIGPEGIYIDSMLEIQEDGKCLAVQVAKRALDQRKSTSYTASEPSLENSGYSWMHRFSASAQPSPTTSKSSWYFNAQDIKEKMEKLRSENIHAEADLSNPDGVDLNAYRIYEVGCNGKYVQDAYRDYRRCGHTSAQTATCCVCTFASCVRWLICSQLPACLVCQIRLIGCVGIPLCKILIGPAVGFAVAFVSALLIIFIWGTCCNDQDKGWKLRTPVVTITSNVIFVVATAVTWCMICRYWTIPGRRMARRNSLESLESVTLCSFEPP